MSRHASFRMGTRASISFEIFRRRARNHRATAVALTASVITPNARRNGPHTAPRFQPPCVVRSVARHFLAGCRRSVWHRGLGRRQGAKLGARRAFHADRQRHVDRILVGGFAMALEPRVAMGTVADVARALGTCAWTMACRARRAKQGLGVDHPTQRRSVAAANRRDANGMSRNTTSRSARSMPRSRCSTKR